MALSKGRTVHMELDPSSSEHVRGVVLVGEVKYKVTGSGIARNADYRQVPACATVGNLEPGILIDR